jgi:glutathione S-transferase
VPARLITIPISHFCEKARWALDRAGVAYLERPHLQLVHVVAARLAGGGRTVPVLVTADGAVLADSTDIAHWADRQLIPAHRLYPDGELGARAAALEAALDAGLGPDGRLWMYQQTLPGIDRVRPWAETGLPSWERVAFRVSGPLVGWAVSRFLGVDEASSAAALHQVEAAFDTIAERLADGRRFLLGDRFTAADLTFAALAAPMLLPSLYGSPLPPPEAMPPEAARQVRRMRAHPAGRFADRLYREERWARRPTAAPG